MRGPLSGAVFGGLKGDSDTPSSPEDLHRASLNARRPGQDHEPQPFRTCSIWPDVGLDQAHDPLC